MSDHQSSSQRPDLDENINVTEAHANLNQVSAAAKREQEVLDPGSDSFPIGVMLVCGVVLMIAGAVLGKGGKFLGYNDLVKPDYVRAEAPGGMEEVATSGPVLAIYNRQGGKIYAAKCAGCHQPDGKGDGANFPPLAASEWVTGDSEALAMAILNGVKGKITVAGRDWNSMMPAQSDGLSPKDLAALMTYLRNNMGNAVGDVISPEMAENAMATSQARGGGQVTESELLSNHNKMISGAEFTLETIVDLESFEPVEQSAE